MTLLCYLLCDIDCGPIPPACPKRVHVLVLLPRTHHYYFGQDRHTAHVVNCGPNSRPPTPAPKISAHAVWPMAQRIIYHSQIDRFHLRWHAHTETAMSWICPRSPINICLNPATIWALRTESLIRFVLLSETLFAYAIPTSLVLPALIRFFGSIGSIWSREIALQRHAQRIHDNV